MMWIYLAFALLAAFIGNETLFIGFLVLSWIVRIYELLESYLDA
jgi:hypothetical protein